MARMTRTSAQQTAGNRNWNLGTYLRIVGSGPAFLIGIIAGTAMDRLALGITFGLLAGGALLSLGIVIESRHRDSGSG